MIKPLRTALPFLASLPAACAGDGLTYPSLAPRAVEQVELTEPAVEAPAAPAADPALDRAIATAVEEREAAARAFDAAAARIEKQVRGARGAAVGSSAWLDAQVALAGLDEARGQHDQKVSALEELAAARVDAGALPYPPLERALSAARAEAAHETQRIDAIAGLVPPA